MVLVLQALMALFLSLPLPASAQPVVPAAASTVAQPPPAAVSATARRVYEAARAQLLQIRTLLKSQDSQASVGSGFLVSEDGHVLTNYHVISQLALEPERYRLRYASTDGQEGQLELLDFDVRRDLALLRVVAAKGAGPGLKNRAALGFRSPAQPLAKGDRIYSMGNPHDVAFAVVEGNYNGLVERSFDALIYYSGSLNAGMSGGPVLDEAGRVVGVNVSAMFFAQQMSFLVPGEYAQALLERSRHAKPITQPAWARLREQLLAYQEELSARFIAQPWQEPVLGSADRYRLPVPQELFMRCWGRGTPADAKGLDFQRSQCRMEHALFINGGLQTGYLSMSHEVYEGEKLGVLRFAKQYSASFRNERMGRDDKVRTAPFCKEEFVSREGLPLRAVICLRAYRKLPGLHDLSVLVTTVDASTQGALGRFNAAGLSFDNALKLSAHYLEGFGWTAKNKQQNSGGGAK
ncbi:S1-C subfamily serine protease [Paucibacter oligotrophus]|uniref:S1-C subfamily serine protease n=1 Tax=Roseateles oligotrophus TaxID=1769250 RepID=A0A840LD43_9BURK|nr:serine protease [Roseateles oligotrophus]MBB4844835.1 S1-C subfamily serine protease [Roseateles oligotrophus]